MNNVRFLFGVFFQIQILTTSDSIRVNRTGHVILQEEAKFIMVTFLVVYALAIPFLLIAMISVAILVGTSIFCRYNRQEKDRSRLLCSVISFSWFLLTAHLVLSIVIGTAESVCTIKNQSFWIICDNDNKFHSDFLVSIVALDILHVAVVVMVYALVLVISCCTHCCFEDKNLQQFQVTLTAVLYGYTVILLWQLVPLTAHFVMFPFRTLAIVVQYIMTLFLLYYLFFQCSQLVRCHTFEPNQSCCTWKCCSCTREPPNCTNTCAFQLLLTLAAIFLLWALGFLYLVVISAGVDTTGVTIFTVSIAMAVVTATTGRILSDNIRDMYHVVAQMAQRVSESARGSK